MRRRVGRPMSAALRSPVVALGSRPAEAAPLAVRVLAASERRAAQGIWEQLEARVAPSAGLACGWRWTSTWLDHFGDVVPHRFLVAERQGTPVGAVLLTEGVGRRRGPFPVRTLHLGTAGEPHGEGVYVEYNRLLVDARDRAPFARAVIAAVHRQPRWDELRLDGFAPEDAEALRVAEPRLRPTRLPCPVMDLDAVRADGGTVLDHLRGSVRWRIRRSMRALGPVDVEWASDPGTALEIFAELVALHQARWAAAGSPGAFASARVVAFHRDLIPAMLERDEVVLFRARAAGRTIGCLYGHVEDGRLLSYQSGFARFEDNRIKPGLAVHALCMEACLERGLSEYDLLAEADRYKQELASAERELVWAYAPRLRPRPLAIHALRVVRDRTQKARGAAVPARVDER
jgi:CelD/BcsL family acetyltransferase involved in cellulose biosynthesis